jgi:hypothetical protein
MIFSKMDRISTVLRDEDIEGFIENGAPKDEYEPEADRIRDLIGRQASPSVDEVCAIVRNVWAELFELDDNDLVKRADAFRRAAEKLVG